MVNKLSLTWMIQLLYQQMYNKHLLNKIIFRMIC